jgi:hypothetical protein
MAVGLEREHNLNVMAPMLLNGENDFFRRERFKRLTRGKKSTLDNFRVMSLTTTFEAS